MKTEVDVLAFNPHQAIQISADDITQLRRCDVDRVIEWCPMVNRTELAEWIKTHRPDLSFEVDEALYSKPIDG